VAVAKTAPSVSNTPATGDYHAAAYTFREVAHKGHQLTHVGSFLDGILGNPPYDVWYCRTDHALFVG
jgi:hypothetical protein